MQRKLPRTSLWPKKLAVCPGGAYEVGHAAFVLAYTKDNRAARDLSPGSETGRLVARSSLSC